MKILTVLTFFFLSAQTFAQSPSFEAYRQGDSKQALKLLAGELKSKTTLDVHYVERALNMTATIYELENDVNEKQLLQFLRTLKAKRVSTDRLSPILAAWQHDLEIYEQNPKLVDVLNYFSALAKLKFGENYDKNMKRLTAFRLMRAYSWRQWKSRMLPSLEWLFLAGAAGFYYHNSGAPELRTYIEKCSGVLRNCKNVAVAQKLLDIGQARMQLRAVGSLEE